MLCNHQSLRNHLTGTGRFAHHKTDGIVLASREEVAAAEEPRRKVDPYVITKDGNGDVVNRAGVAVPGPASQAFAAPATIAAQSKPQPRPGFFPAQSSPRPSPASRQPRTRPLYDKEDYSGHLPRTRPLYDDSDYPGVPREVHLLEHEQTGRWLVRGNVCILRRGMTGLDCMGFMSVSMDSS